MAGRFHQGSSAISVMNLTFMIPKTVLLRFGIIQKCYVVVFLFLSISKFSTHENMKTNSQASSTVVEEEKSHTKKNSKRGLVIKYNLSSFPFSKVTMRNRKF